MAMNFAPKLNLPPNVVKVAIGVGAFLLLGIAVRAPLGHILRAASGSAEQTADAGAAETAPPAADAPVPVHVARVQMRDMPITLDAIGTVQAINTATIRTQVSGRLVKLWFKDGEDVRRGDLLASIDHSLYQAQYDQAVAKKAQDAANLANARLDLVRYKKLTVGQYGSQQQYDTQKYLVAQLEAQLRADQAVIDSASTTLEYCAIRSPIDGRAGLRQVDVGNILRETDPNGLVVVTQLKPIYVMFTLPQQALLDIQASMAHGKPRVAALAPDNATVIDSGEVSAIDNIIDQATGTAKIRASFPNAAMRLWPGQFVNARVVIDTAKKAVVAPVAAIQQGARGPVAYVVKNGVVAVRPVKTGFQDENFVVVTDGLDVDAVIVNSGFSRLTDGAKVRVVPVAEKPAADKEKGPKRDQGTLKNSREDSRAFELSAHDLRN